MRGPPIVALSMRFAAVPFLIVTCMLGGCRHAPRTGGPLPAPTMPVGFVTVVPTRDDHYAANRSRCRWRVSLAESGVGVIVTQADERARDTGPPLPFPPPSSRLDMYVDAFEMTPDRHVLQVGDRIFIGQDLGEWGGSLDLYDLSGSHIAELASDNTQGVIEMGGRVVSIHGLNHLGMREGTVRFWRREGGTFVSDGERPLDAGPECYVLADDVLWILTASGLWRVAGREVVRVHEVDVAVLYPNSLVVDGAGDVWAGMRWFVLRLRKRGRGFEEQWLAPGPD
jgi:hypothetical protein